MKVLNTIHLVGAALLFSALTLTAAPTQPKVGTNEVATITQLNIASNVNYTAMVNATNAGSGYTDLVASNKVRIAAGPRATITTSSPAPGVMLFTIVSAGETNVVVTLGSGEGVGLFLGKSGETLNFLGLNAGQFGTNSTTASIKPFAPATNMVLYYPSLPGLAANRVQLIDAAGNETNHPTATKADVDNILNGSGPFQAQIDLGTPRTIHDGSTNTILQILQGAWTALTDPATIDFTIPRQLITLTAGFAPNMINTNNGLSTDLIVIAASAQNFSIPGVLWPEGIPTNNFSGIYRFRLEVVGASRQPYGYYTSTNTGAGLGGGSGEANTMSVTGTGVGIVNPKSSVDLPTKSFVDTSTLLAWASNANEISLSFDWVQATGSVATISYARDLGSNSVRIAAGANVAVDTNYTGSGVTYTMSASGGGFSTTNFNGIVVTNDITTSNLIASAGIVAGGAGTFAGPVIAPSLVLPSTGSILSTDEGYFEFESVGVVKFTDNVNGVARVRVSVNVESNVTYKIYNQAAFSSLTNFVPDFAYSEVDLLASAITNHIYIPHTTNWPSGAKGFTAWNIFTGHTNRHLIIGAPSGLQYLMGTNSNGTNVPVANVLLASNHLWRILFVSHNGANAGVRASYPVSTVWP